MALHYFLLITVLSLTRILFKNELLYFCLMKRLAIFVSGSGTNMHRIANYFSNHPQIEISLVVCNNPNAGAIARAKSLGIPLLMINRKSFKNPKTLIDELYKKQIDWIILAGFLWLIPKALIQAYPNKIVNIHPALLP